MFRRRAPSPPRAAVRTDVGKVRKVNEDRVLDRGALGLWAVADGMGGMQAGDVAAQAVVDALGGLASVGEAEVVAVLEQANRAIRAEGGGRSGSTVVAALVAGGKAIVLWAGDSRAYHVRGGVARQVSRDHSLVQDMVDAGLLKPEEAEDHPRSNVITRALGVAAEVAIDRVEVPLVRGDRIFLCSDGVSRSLDLGDLARREPIEALADRLLAGALARDGSDNASLVLIET